MNQVQTSGGGCMAKVYKSQSVGRDAACGCTTLPEVINKIIMKNHNQIDLPYSITVNWMVRYSSSKKEHIASPVITMWTTKYSGAKRISLRDALPYIESGYIPLTDDLRKYMVRKGHNVNF